MTTLNGVKMWLTDYTGEPKEVEVFPTYKREYFFLPDAENTMGGKVVWAGALHSSREQAVKAILAERQRRLREAENDLKRMQTRLS